MCKERYLNDTLLFIRVYVLLIYASRYRHIKTRVFLNDVGEEMIDLQSHFNNFSVVSVVGISA